MFHTNTQRMNLVWKKKDAILNDLSTDLSGELYKINTDDKIPNNYRYTLTTQFKLLRIKNKHKRFSKVT